MSGLARAFRAILVALLVRGAAREPRRVTRGRDEDRGRARLRDSTTAGVSTPFDIYSRIPAAETVAAGLPALASDPPIRPRPELTEPGAPGPTWRAVPVRCRRYGPPMSVNDFL